MVPLSVSGTPPLVAVTDKDPVPGSCQVTFTVSDVDDPFITPPVTLQA